MNFFKLREKLEEQAPTHTIVFKAPFQLFDKGGKKFTFDVTAKHNAMVSAASDDRFLAISGTKDQLKKVLNDPRIKGKVDADDTMKNAVKFTGKAKFKRNKGANFTN